MSSITVLCPITRATCRNGCVRECTSGIPRAPADPPYGSGVDYSLLVTARVMLADIASQLSSHDGSYREGLCSERCEHASMAIRQALDGLAIFLDDERAAAVIAPRKATI